MPTERNAETTAEIANRLGISRSRVLNFMHALEVEGKLRRRSEKRRYIDGFLHTVIVYFVEG